MREYKRTFPDRNSLATETILFIIFYTSEEGTDETELRIFIALESDTWILGALCCCILVHTPAYITEPVCAPVSFSLKWRQQLYLFIGILVGLNELIHGNFIKHSGT